MVLFLDKRNRHSLTLRNSNVALSMFSLYSTGNWLPNTNEIDTKNMKCTCPTREISLGSQRNLYSTDLRWGFALGVTQILGLALGFGVGGNANFRFGVGGKPVFAFLDTNMFVSPRRNCGVGGLSQWQDPTQKVLPRSGI